MLDTPIASSILLVEREREREIGLTSNSIVPLIPEPLRIVLTATVLSEPSGNPTVAGMGGCAVASVALYGYFASLGNPSGLLLTTAVAFGLSGIAESFPTTQRRLAGALRLSAMILLLGFVGVIFTTPGTVLSVATTR
ncbi:MAG: hypothetical protein A07HR60_02837 [uncultured archaeon A07HR60]|nr:MAG: hypothetical protein A07HR60_02837 [uncultured archaeon A07HR60]